MVIVIYIIVENVNKFVDGVSFDSYLVEIIDYFFFWEEFIRNKDDSGIWVDVLRLKKV